MQEPNSEVSVERKVSVPLGIGIALLPGLFVWFLLRRGHSTAARAFGFGWAGLLLLVSVTTVGIAPHPSQTARLENASEAKEASAGAAAPRDDEETPIIARRAELSVAAKRMKQLYDELNGFRRDPEFLRVGFGTCCRFNKWKQNVEELDRTSGPALFKELGIPAGELLELGLEYALHDGRQTELAKTFSSRIEFALTPIQPISGSGRAMKEGWWCKSIDTWFASLKAAEAGDYAKSSNLVYEPECPHVRPNALTGPELERRYYTFANGTSRAEFVRVKLKSGVEVWAPLDAIEFRR